MKVPATPIILLFDKSSKKSRLLFINLIVDSSSLASMVFSLINLSLIETTPKLREITLIFLSSS